MLKRAAVIGLGLIGGSVGLGLLRQNIHVTAFDQNSKSLSQGIELGVIDVAAGSVAEAVAGAELVILAVPVLAVGGILEALKVANFQGVITDVGSVKHPVLQKFIDVFGEVPAQFVPGHPIAGSEQHGVTAANGDLFRAHRVLLTPLAHTNADATEQVSELWRSLGADVSLMTADHHDSILAQTSHLPHLLAYALIDTLSVQGDSLEIFEYAAGGLRDFSRIAASDPTMWRDIFMSNRTALLSILDQYTGELQDLRRTIDTGDSEALFAMLSRSKTARDHFSDLLQKRQKSTSPGGKP
ncbi:MAG: prephenate dehydrogenase [Candidatus Azotimanducaceae bacterium]|jgi:prephenate dehydrogenase